MILFLGRFSFYAKWMTKCNTWSFTHWEKRLFQSRPCVKLLCNAAAFHFSLHSHTELTNCKPSSAFFFLPQLVIRDSHMSIWVIWDTGGRDGWHAHADCVPLVLLVHDSECTISIFFKDCTGLIQLYHFVVLTGHTSQWAIQGTWWLGFTWSSILSSQSPGACQELIF